MSAFETIARGVRDVLVLQERFAGFDRSLVAIEARVERLADSMIALDRRLAVVEGRLQGRAEGPDPVQSKRLPRRAD